MTFSRKSEEKPQQINKNKKKPKLAWVRMFKTNDVVS